MTSNPAIHKFVEKQRELLDLELQAEKEESTTESSSGGETNQEPGEGRRSHVLGRLEASDVSVGLYGRTVVQLTPWSSSTSSEAAADQAPLEKQSRSSPLLPAHRFTVGNEVEIRTKGSLGGGSGKTKAISGVISAVTEASISVAISDDKRSPSPSFKPSNIKGKGGSNRNQKGNNNKHGKQQDHENEDETSLLDCAPLTLVPRSSIEVHKRLMAALNRLEKHGEDHPIAGSVIRSIFAAPKFSTVVDDRARDLSENHREPSKSNDQHPSKSPERKNSDKKCFNPGLDVSQQEAIAFALDPERPISLIHGPPGTGKTTTVAELIRQAVHYHGMRVLVTAPSNVAVDNILERLTTEPREGQPRLPPLRTVRLGHPARIKPSIARHSLEALVQSSDGTEIVNDVRRELESHLRVLSRGKGRRSDPPKSSRRQQGQSSRQGKIDKRTAYKEIKSLRKEVRQREEKVVRELIRSAHVVLATTVGADNRVLNQITNPSDDNHHNGTNLGFDLVIIDEAAQALEASCWIPILRGRKVVLAGDHCQLPPTIKSNNPLAIEGLSVTLFERLMGLHKRTFGNRERDISRMLQIQYRMHHKIADWASQAMYHDELSTHDSVRNRTLGQLDSVRKQLEGNSRPDKSKEDFGELDQLGENTLLLINTAGCDMHERETEAGSRYNEGEAMLVSQHVRKLLVLGVDPSQVAIITPYNGQVELLRNKLLPDFPKLEIRSVDGFQGGEREAVILSLVRSSEQRGGRKKGHGIGFLKDDRRQNVAVTRAKRHLAVICDSDTVSQSPFIQNLIEWVEKYGEERSAIEYVSDSLHSESFKEYEDDLKFAELELMNLLEETSTANNASKTIDSTTTKEIVPDSASMKDKSTQDASTKKEHTQSFLEESKRKALMDKIAVFIETGAKGEEMVLSSELSSFDRRLIHEFAEQSALGHRSEGKDGVDRKIILTIQKESSTKIFTRQQTATENDNTTPKFVSNFSALAIDNGDSESDESDTNKNQNTSKQNLKDGVPAANSLLSQLAKERSERQKEQQKSQTKASNASSKKKKKAKPRGQKLGGAKKSPPKEEDNLNDLDDMAFLDAQIEKAQNAHGRKVVGSGKNYRTVVNGILNSRPEPRPTTTNSSSRASAALRSKLSQAENARKKKKKKR